MQRITVLVPSLVNKLWPNWDAHASKSWCDLLKPKEVRLCCSPSKTSNTRWKDSIHMAVKYSLESSFSNDHQQDCVFGISTSLIWKKSREKKSKSLRTMLTCSRCCCKLCPQNSRFGGVNHRVQNLALWLNNPEEITFFIFKEYLH